MQAVFAESVKVPIFFTHPVSADGIRPSFLVIIMNCSVQYIAIPVPISLRPYQWPCEIIIIILPTGVIHLMNMYEEMRRIYLGRLPVGIKDIKGLFLL